MSADLIIHNAKIWTMDPVQPRAAALAIAAGHLLVVGAEAEVMAKAGPETRILDAKGATVLPGFVESHLHLGMGGAELSHLHLGHIRGFDAIAAAFRAFAAAQPDAPLLMGQGADYAMMDHPVSRHDLDRIIADRPIAMTSHDHHTIWANTEALRQAGLLHGMATPAGHEVVMGEDGLATGELREFEAFAPVVALGGLARMNLAIATGGEPDPRPTAAEFESDKAHFEAGQKHCARFGITSMVMMDGNLYSLECLQSLREEGRLLARVKVPFHYKPHMTHKDLDRAEAMRAAYNDAWLSAGFVKMFMDGVMDSGTAYMINDYPLMPGHRSEPLFPPEIFNPLAVEIDRRGLQIAVHAIGDGAVRTVIDGYEAARAANGPRDARHRIEHIELIDADDIPRLGDLQIVASLQPSHPPGAMDFGLEPTLTNIGAARWKDAYLHRSLKEAGAPIAYASDWPVTDVAVMRSVQAALTRAPYAPDLPNECLSLEEVLYAYTAGGAWAGHFDAVTGTLRAGLAGDVVILDADLAAVAPADLGAVEVAYTICGGRVTYSGAV